MISEADLDLLQQALHNMSETDFNTFDAGAEFKDSLIEEVSEYDRSDALQLAATL